MTISLEVIILGSLGICTIILWLIFTVNIDKAYTIVQYITVMPSMLYVQQLNFIDLLSAAPLTEILLNKSI